MKKSLLLGIVATSIGVASSHGQGKIFVDNYNSTLQPLITFNGVAVDNSFKMGLYYAQGNQVAGTVADPSGVAVPTALNALLLLGSGTGSVTPWAVPGRFAALSQFTASPNAGDVVTIEIVVYNGQDYASSLVRGHSNPFIVTAPAGSATPPIYTGDFMPSFSVAAVPEPATFALIGLGTGALLFLRRRK